MRIEVLDDAARLAARAAYAVAERARSRVAETGRFSVAFSGGGTPRRMLEVLAEREVPWDAVHVFQVDERLVAQGHAQRNLAMMREHLLDRAKIPAANVHPMPVDDGEKGPRGYAKTLQRVCGGVLDLVHLGLGADGHTASLVPGDPVLEVDDADVSLTGLYQRYRRMTLTAPAINRAAEILWVVSGADKAVALQALMEGDAGIPASLIRRERALVLADWGAAALIKV